MKVTHFMRTMACVAVVYGGAAVGAEEEEVDSGLAWKMGEGITYGEQSIVSAEAGVSFDTKYLSYGLVDNNDPILTPSADITIMDWFTFGVSAIFDMTKYGRKRDSDGERLYTNRAGRYQELDPTVGLAHSFSKEDYPWLPTTVDLSLYYMYEYHPRSCWSGENDSQYVVLDVSLPDLWIEPTLEIERDFMRDDGVYVNLDLGHTFELLPSLTFRPSVAQGIGNTRRTRGYGIAEDHGGLMDSWVKGELAYEFTSGVTLSGYVAYSDYIFDRTLRHGARDYEASGHWDESWNFTAGLALMFAF